MDRNTGTDLLDRTRDRCEVCGKRVAVGDVYCAKHE